MSLTPYSGAWGRPQALHLLRRATFGASRTDIAYFAGLSVTQAVNELLAIPSAAPAPPVNDYTYNGANPDATVPYGSTWVNAVYDSNVNYARLQSLRGWWVGLMINENRSIVEKMTLFLHNLLPINIGGAVGHQHYCYEYVALLRSYALGNYKNLVRDITIDRGMLDYLDGNTNTATAPNENYARELQELFTIGKDLPSYYTQSDVEAAAKVLTGWRLVGSTANSFGPAYSRYYDPAKHNTTNKTFSSFYNNTVITGQTGATGGQIEIDALMDMIFANNEVANYIVRKIYRFFVYYNIDATIESTIIQPLATTFRNSGYDLKAVMLELLNSQHFYDINEVACIIKSPIEFTVNVARATNMVFPAATDPYNLYRGWRVFYDKANSAQMQLGSPPNVAGWAAWGQGPNYHELWITADTLRNRKLFIDTISNGGGYNSNTIRIDLFGFTASLTAPGDPNILIDELFELFHPLEPDATLTQSLKQATLLSNQLDDNYWTIAWNNYISNPTTANVNTVKTRLKDLYTAILNMAEGHLV
ncbi:MAG: hypothetical protein RLZZ292_332 [Bacteroidota bacterium]|jgi:uncharacterized protein (DUF1800 family)